jgi:hypothetical protein
VQERTILPEGFELRGAASGQDIRDVIHACYIHSYYILLTNQGSGAKLRRSWQGTPLP